MKQYNVTGMSLRGVQRARGKGGAERFRALRNAR